MTATIKSQGPLVLNKINADRPEALQANFSSLLGHSEQLLSEVGHLLVKLTLVHTRRLEQRKLMRRWRNPARSKKDDVPSDSQNADELRREQNLKDLDQHLTFLRRAQPSALHSQDKKGEALKEMQEMCKNGEALRLYESDIELRLQLIKAQIFESYHYIQTRMVYISSLDPLLRECKRRETVAGESLFAKRIHALNKGEGKDSDDVERKSPTSPRVSALFNANPYVGKIDQASETWCTHVGGNPSFRLNVLNPKDLLGREDPHMPPSQAEFIRGMESADYSRAEVRIMRIRIEVLNSCLVELQNIKRKATTLIELCKDPFEPRIQVQGLSFVLARLSEDIFGSVPAELLPRAAATDTEEEVVDQLLSGGKKKKRSTSPLGTSKKDVLERSDRILRHRISELENFHKRSAFAGSGNPSRDTLLSGLSREDSKARREMGRPRSLTPTHSHAHHTLRSHTSMGGRAKTTPPSPSPTNPIDAAHIKQKFRSGTQGSAPHMGGTGESSKTPTGTNPMNIRSAMTIRAESTKKLPPIGASGAPEPASKLTADFGTQTDDDLAVTQPVEGVREAEQPVVDAAAVAAANKETIKEHHRAVEVSDHLGMYTAQKLAKSTASPASQAIMHIRQRVGTPYSSSVGGQIKTGLGGLHLVGGGPTVAVRSESLDDLLTVLKARVPKSNISKSQKSPPAQPRRSFGDRSDGKDHEEGVSDPKKNAFLVVASTKVPHTSPTQQAHPAEAVIDPQMGETVDAQPVPLQESRSSHTVILPRCPSATTGDVQAAVTSDDEVMADDDAAGGEIICPEGLDTDGLGHWMEKEVERRLQKHQSELEAQVKVREMRIMEEVSSMRTEVDRYRREADTAQQQLQDQNRLLIDKMSVLQKLQREYNARSTEICELRAEMDSKEEVLAERNRVVEALESENLRIRAEIDSLTLVDDPRIGTQMGYSKQHTSASLRDVRTPAAPRRAQDMETEEYADEECEPRTSAPVEVQKKQAPRDVKGDESKPKSAMASSESAFAQVRRRNSRPSVRIDVNTDTTPPNTAVETVDNVPKVAPLGASSEAESRSTLILSELSEGMDAAVDQTVPSPSDLISPESFNATPWGQTNSRSMSSLPGSGPQSKHREHRK